MILYPFKAAINAKPRPVFPAVASIIVPPGWRSPEASASSIIESPIRSFIDPPDCLTPI